MSSSPPVTARRSSRRRSSRTRPTTRARAAFASPSHDGRVSRLGEHVRRLGGRPRVADHQRALPAASARAARSTRSTRTRTSISSASARRTCRAPPRTRTQGGDGRGHRSACSGGNGCNRASRRVASSSPAAPAPRTRASVTRAVRSISIRRRAGADRRGLARRRWLGDTVRRRWHLRPHRQDRLVDRDDRGADDREGRLRRRRRRTPTTATPARAATTPATRTPASAAARRPVAAVPARSCSWSSRSSLLRVRSPSSPAR